VKLNKALSKLSENCHVRGSVHCKQYNAQGTMIASVGMDKLLCFYHGKTMELIHRMELLHTSSIYLCAWNSHGDQLLTCSADGYVHLVSTKDYDFRIIQSWDLVKSGNGDGNGNSDAGHSNKMVIIGMVKFHLELCKWGVHLFKGIYQLLFH
jgi:WD40 repeat protein